MFKLAGRDYMALNGKGFLKKDVSGLGFEVLSPSFLFMSTISLDSFLTILCRLSKFALSFSVLYSVGLPGGCVSKSPLLDGCCIAFLDKKIGLSLHPFIWNLIILGSSRFLAKVGLADLFRHINIDTGNVLAYTSICSFWVGLELG